MNEILSVNDDENQCIVVEMDNNNTLHMCRDGVDVFYERDRRTSKVDVQLSLFEIVF